MHSRVFEITKTKIDEWDRMTESDLYESSNFVGPIADYLSDNNDRNDDINWLLRYIGPHEIEYDEEENSIIFSDNFAVNYFENRFKKFKDSAEKITLKEFSEGFHSVYKIQQYLEEIYGFYVFDFDEGVRTFDSFIREVQPGVKYYIGGTVDYHC